MASSALMQQSRSLVLLDELKNRQVAEGQLSSLLQDCMPARRVTVRAGSRRQVQFRQFSPAVVGLIATMVLYLAAARRGCTIGEEYSETLSLTKRNGRLSPLGATDRMKQLTLQVVLPFFVTRPKIARSFLDFVFSGRYSKIGGVEKFSGRLGFLAPLVFKLNLACFYAGGGGRRYLSDQISSMLESGHVRADALQSLIGRLLFYTQMCPIYREGLSCLYSTSNIMEKKKLNRVRCSARVTGCLERWMEVVSSEFTRVISSAEPGNDSERPEDLDGLILGDASTSALGCIALPRKGRGVYCRLNVEDLRDLEEVNIHERTCGNMVALELTATLMGIMLAKKIGLSPAKVLILSDSKSGVGALKKSFSAKIGPARLVAAITQIMSDGAHISALTHTGDKINHIKGLLNVEADKISRDPNYAPPGLEEHRITVREIEAALSGRM
ncbi:hypothetical protein FOZ60_012639 [Perkinsus olseni]|uniref:Uncharacterized protein n=1 Tax=Perkinsus olseni TaxID=32597 RepID=A0A7J6NC26_PEROL|nr:hypothetical protein FOZ60_012639 [Perkinsus olseni]